VYLNTHLDIRSDHLLLRCRLMSAVMNAATMLTSRSTMHGKD